jgi:hypothetical protein
MKGSLIKTQTGWRMHLMTSWEDEVYVKSYPVHPSQTTELDAKFNDNCRYEFKHVAFEVVTEFTHPSEYLGVPLWDGTDYAKITTNGII